MAAKETEGNRNQSPALREDPHEDPVHSSPWWWWLPSLAVLVLSFASYSSTASEFVQGGDSGELMAMACASGVPHPPGYPLLTMAGSLWLHLSNSLNVGGTPALHLSLLSASFGSAAAGMLALACGVASGGGWLEGAVAACLWALSETTWKYSQHYEVFSLNNLLCSSLLLLAMLHLRGRGRARLWAPEAGSFVIGLGMCNQHTIVLLAAPLVLSILSTRSISPSRIGFLTLILLLGLAPYAYLPLSSASSAPPLGSWGDHRSFEGFMRHVLRREYGTLQLYTSGSSEKDFELKKPLLSRFPSVAWRLLIDSSHTAALIGAPLGLASLLTEKTQQGGGLVAACLSLSLSVYISVFGSLANLPAGDFFTQILDRFSMQPQLLITVLAAVGLRQVGTRFGKMPTWVAVAAVAASMGRNCEWRSGFRNKKGDVAGRRGIVERFGRDVLMGLPEGAVVLSTGDIHYYPLLYLQQCAGIRPDVLPINTAMAKGVWFKPVQSHNYPNVTFPASVYVASSACPIEQGREGGAYGIDCWLRQNLRGGGKGGDKRVFLAKTWPPGDDIGSQEEGAAGGGRNGLGGGGGEGGGIGGGRGWVARPFGLVKEVVSAASKPGKRAVKKWERWIKESIAALPPLDDYIHYYGVLPGGDGWGEGLDNWEQAVVHDYLTAHTATSKFLIASLRDDSSKLGLPNNHTETASLALTASRTVYSALPSEALPAKNLGALLQHLMNVAGSEEDRRKYMAEMVAVYNDFVRLSIQRGDGDPDGPILRDWVSQVEQWMVENNVPRYSKPK